MRFEPDAPVWVSDAERAWRPARVVAANDGEVKLELLDLDEDGPGAGDSILQVPLSGPGTRQLLRRDPALEGDGALRFDDLTEVPELHGAEVLHALEVRFAHGSIYTLTGPVLLALNPFRALPGLYGPEALRGFLPGASAGTAASAEQPHVFAIAARALQGIQERCASQTVLISGESGAGKTETTKFVMQFLALAGAEASVAAATGPTLAAAIAPRGRHRTESTGRPRTESAAAARRHGGAAAVPEVRSPSHHHEGGGMSRVERQVLGSNPLLEAFGNAKTLRNDNSSRFGKYIELQFGVDRPGLPIAPRLVGARIRTYLLEKVRVVGQQDGERNFHVFYQALAAAQTPARLAAAGAPLALSEPGRTLAAPAQGSFGLGRAEEEGDVDLQAFAGHSAASFAYLSPPSAGAGARAASSPPAMAGEVEGFEATMSAMRSVGFGTQEASQLFRTLAAVLHLGNVQFARINDESCEVGTPSPTQAEGSSARAQARPALEVVCGLLGVSTKALSLALCSRTMQAPGEAVIRMPNSVSKAVDGRDALARHLYHAVFNHVVHRSNSSIGFQEKATFCGVLDIFGFEFFETNSFEQLCINYTNELLQQYFNTFIFQNEATLYQEEGIEWEPLDFPDNGAIVDLLHEKLAGVLPMLEEECFSVGGSSDSWQGKLVKKHESHPNFGVIKQKAGVFLLKHFAGPVTYTCEGFLEKNRDQLSSDLLQCLKESSSEFVRERFLQHDRVFGTSVEQSKGFAGASGRVMKAQRYSVSSEFRQQLQELLAQIRTTSPHFIRCIKPNPKNRPFVDPRAPNPVPLFDRQAVAEQLSYQGVLEAIRVARAGFPVRLRHQDFLGEFRCLAPRELEVELKRLAASSPVAAVKALVQCDYIQTVLAGAADTVTHAGKRTRWAIGATRVFMKQEPYSALRAARLAARHAAATRLQSEQRRRAAQAAWERFRRAIRRLQGAARSRAARDELRRRRRERAAVRLEAGVRMLRCRRRFALKRRAALAAQSWVRGQRCRRQYIVDRAKMLQLQRWWRSVRQRRRWRNLQRDMLRLQCAWRGHVGRRAALERKVARQRLRTVLRVLVRLRRKNLAYRAWRKEILAKYRGPSKPAPSRSILVEQLVGVFREYEEKQVELQRLRAERDEWISRLDALRGRALLRVRRLITQQA